MSVLSDELTNDPETLGYATPLTAGDHQEVARLLNEPRYSTPGAKPIASTTLLDWGGKNGRIANLKDAAGNTNNSAELRSIAEAALLMIQRSDTNLDMSQSEILGMLDALKQASVFSQTDIDSLNAMSTTDISRAEQLGLGRVSIQEVRNAA